MILCIYYTCIILFVCHLQEDIVVNCLEEKEYK